MSGITNEYVQKLTDKVKTRTNVTNVTVQWNVHDRPGSIRLLCLAIGLIANCGITDLMSYPSIWDYVERADSVMNDVDYDGLDVDHLNITIFTENLDELAPVTVLLVASAFSSAHDKIVPPNYV